MKFRVEQKVYESLRAKLIETEKNIAAFEAQIRKAAERGQGVSEKQLNELLRLRLEQALLRGEVEKSKQKLNEALKEDLKFLEDELEAIKGESGKKVRSHYQRAIKWLEGVVALRKEAEELRREAGELYDLITRWMSLGNEVGLPRGLFVISIPTPYPPQPPFEKDRIKEAIGWLDQFASALDNKIKELRGKASRL